MNAMKLLSPFALLLVTACGGAARPAETEPNPAALLAEEPHPAARLAASPELQKGIDALERGDLPGAKAAFGAILQKNARDGQAAQYLGATEERLGDKVAAEKAYRAALSSDPNLEGAAENLAALLIDGERLDEALLLLRDAIARHAKSGPLRLNLAVALAAKGDSAAAATEFDAATRRAPGDPMFLLTYGHWLGVWKQSDVAATKLRAALPRAAGDLGLLASIGHELRLVGAFSDCITTYDKAIAMKDAAELRTERALCRLGNKDKAGAASDLEAAVAKEPGFAPAHFYLGGRLAEAGKWKECAREYEAYGRLAPEGDLARQAAERAKLARERAAGK